MAVFRVRLLVHALRFLPRKALALVFEEQRAGGQIGEGEHAPAMNGRIADNGSTHGVAGRSIEFECLSAGAAIAVMPMPAVSPPQRETQGAQAIERHACALS
ncbi:hypothetical protein GCM10010985_35980 [Caballeronia grimmiae]|uniref:Secreted protein n=1 Tax=Caballeronia grimmiae TaxID=1071679 RepID=A0ABQ1RTC9_9BURK|nr:hypothetical protein GCM10010985_35980 [Caballeronia grimmiae]